MLVQILTYPDIEAAFVKYKRDKEAPFTLFELKIKNQTVEIGRYSKITLRGNHDLSKLDDFRGFQDISLKNVNLEDEVNMIKKMTYDNLTEWPSIENLPSDFDPDKILEYHKTPGLNISELHLQGITGNGVGIAIIDQPLLQDHDEYKTQIIHYDAADLINHPPQMHGSPIVSIAVGKNIGVAPEASLSYFAVPMWKKDNSPYINALVKINSLNETLSDHEKIRVISISDGNFSSKSNYSEWQEILKQTEATGIMVVTCDPAFLDYGTLNTEEGKDPDDPNNYRKNKYASDSNEILIPAGNRTLASHRGNNVYVFDREGGRSWAAPYIAGLAALAFQVNPKITPNKIKELMLNTATKTQEGLIIYPTKFIDSTKRNSIAK
jgi:subtilisin family serine protease